MFLPFQLLVEYRVSYVSVETCPLWYSGEASEIYGKWVRTVECEHGTYHDTYEFPSNEYVGDSESCPTSDFSSDYDDGISYGNIVNITDEYTLPLTRSDVQSHLEGMAPDWQEWSTLTDNYSSTGLGFGVFDGVFESSGSSQYVSEAGDIGGGLGEMSGSREEVEWRFTLQIPVACTVVYQIGSLSVEEGGEYTWGGEQELIVSSTPQTVTCPVANGYYKRLKIVRVIVHPWT